MKDYETTLISDCCKAPVNESEPDIEGDEKDLVYTCIRCTRACYPLKVCAYCLGTGRIAVVNGPDDFDIEPCPNCEEGQALIDQKKNDTSGATPGER